MGSSSDLGDTIRIVTVDATTFGAKWPEGRTYYAPGATQFGITWTFHANCQVGQFANQDIWVIGPVTIDAITPASKNVDGRIMNGSMVNPSPLNFNQGYDNAMANNIYDASLNAAYKVSAASPLVLAVSSSLISATSIAAAESRPQLETAAILTVLATAPADGSFRPPYCGTDKTIRHNRRDLNYGLLSTLAPVPDTMSWSTVEKCFERPWIDHSPGWCGAYIHPRQNMPNYGGDMATQIGFAALMLHVNCTNAQKETLLIRFVQLGIDFYGIVKTGGLNNWIGAGGHGTGRKWPILFAGLVLNDAGMRGIGARSGDYLYSKGYGPENIPPDYIHFGEDDQTFYVAQLDVTLTNGPTWKPDSRDTCRQPYLQSDVGLPEWGIWHAGYPQYSNKCLDTEYRAVVGMSLDGLALAALIMNAKELWNHNAFFDYTDRYMKFTGPGGEMEGWWRSYSKFAGQMWDAYRSRYGPVWPAQAGNGGPSLSLIGDQQVTAGQTLRLTVGAVNPSGSRLTYSASPLPSGATFSDQTFTWTPTPDQIGTCQVTFTVSDGQAQDSETITITVVAAQAPNSPPVLGAIGSKSVRENELLSFSISATDADSQDTLTYSATGLPSGAGFSGRTFSWKPGYDQAGSHQVTFIVSDGHSQDSEAVTILVANTDRAPVLSGISDQSVDSGSTLRFSLSAADADGDSLTYSAVGMPTGATLTGRDFTWTPTASQTGSYDVTFTVSDGSLHDSKTATITARPDTTAPAVVRCTPEPDSIQVPLNSLVTVHVTDAGTGVDPSTVVIVVNNQIVYQGKDAIYVSSYGRCRRSGSKSDYQYVYQPDRMFDFDQVVVVKVKAADLQGNVMSTYRYSYVTEMRSFGANKPVSNDTSTSGASKPVTVCDTAGNLWAAWHAGPQGGRDIYVTRLAPGAESFLAPVRLTTDAQDQCNPDLAAGADGKVYITWQDNRRGNWDIFASICSDHQNFSGQTRVSDSKDNEINPAIAVDRQSPGRVYVAWQDGRNGNQDIYVAASADGFASTTLSRVTTNVANQTDPDIAIDGQNTVYLVWTDMRNGQADLYGAASNAGPWTNVPIVTAASDQADPAVAAEPGGSTLHLLWVDNTRGDQDIYYASLAGLPNNPVTGRSIVDDASDADQVSPTVVCAENGTAFACWQDSRHAGPGGADTDLYFAELKSGVAKTNILVGDDNTNTGQSEPAIGVNTYGHPYLVWVDERGQPAQIYYAAATFIDPDPLDSKLVTASAGATIGTEPSAIDQPDDVSIVVPPGACATDLRMTISRILNPQVQAIDCMGSYDFGPSGIDFGQPVTVTIPYAHPADGGRQPLPYWYDSLTGTMSQQGITDVETIVVSSTLNALRFKTTHFTAFYVVAGGSGWGGTSSGSGGCSISATGKGSPKELVLPYAAIATIVIILRRRDRRRQKLLERSKE